jgi:hypothetical protein
MTDYPYTEPNAAELEADARARFATFGPEYGAEDALTLARAGATVMSYQYGDDDAFVAIEAGELAEAIAEDGAAAVYGYWGPFAVWHAEGWTEADTARVLALARTAEAGAIASGLAEPAPVDIADVIARALVPAAGLEPVDYQRGMAAAVIRALGAAGCTILAPQDMTADGCNGSESGEHELSLSLCAVCLEYVF